MYDLYRRRNFGEKVTATFSFIRENWKPLLLHLTYWLLPVSLLQAVFLGRWVDVSFLSVLSADGDPDNLPYTSWSYLAGIGLSLLGAVLLVSLVYALMRGRSEWPDGLRNADTARLWPLLIHNVGRVLMMTLFGLFYGFFLCLAIGILAAITPVTLVLTLPLLCFSMVPLGLMAPIYLFERETSVFGAFRKAFRIGVPTWGGTFLMGFILYLITSCLSGFLSLPYYALLFVKFFFTLQGSDSGTDASPLYNILSYFALVLQTFASYVTMSILYIGMAYQYGHAREVAEGVSVKQEIDDFENF